MKQLTITNGFTRMSDDNLSVKASQINAAMTGNPAFVDPVPSLADLGDAIEAFNTALNNSRDGDRLKAAIKNQKREELIELLHLLADYVLFKSEGDTVTAMSSNFTIGKSPEPREITKPQDPRLLQGENSGELIPKVDRVAGAIGYLHQYATEADMAQGKWTTIASSRSKCRITDLTPGTRYYYRVAAWVLRTSLSTAMW